MDARLDEAVLCYGRSADVSVGLLKLLTLDWSRRPAADESLFFFSGGACDLRNTVVDLPSDIGVACSQHAPPPFVPQPWLSYWCRDQSAWYFGRSDDLVRSTWSVPPCVPRPWGVYWSKTRSSFYFRNECTMEYVWDEALIYGVQPDAATGVREDAGVVVDAEAGTDAGAELCENVRAHEDVNVDSPIALGTDVGAISVVVSGSLRCE